MHMLSPHETSMKPILSYDVLGLPIAATSLRKASLQIHAWSNDDTGRYVGARDVASLVAMSEDSELQQVATGAAMNLPDGMPIVLVGKMLGQNVSRTCGPDLMEKMLLESDETGLRHFFFGGKKGVAEALRDRFLARNPKIQVAGCFSPPFGQVAAKADEETTKMLRDSGADVVWVGMSSPRQDQWMAKHVDRLPMTLIGVGAAFDFHAGTVRRAPKVMQKMSMEWLYRLLSEPRRLWRRYLVMAPKFVWRVAFQRPSRP